MARIVIFDRELHEALTVVEIPASFMRGVADGFHPRHFRVYVPEEIDLRVSAGPPQCKTMRIVTITLEPVMRGREPSPIFWYGYPDDPELVLLLRAAFLPGQVGEVQRREKIAFVKGLFMGASL